MGDWRLDRLHEIAALDLRMVPSASQRAYVNNARLGWRVTRPGVPGWGARMSWHFTFRRAESTASRWNEALVALRRTGQRS